MCRVSGAQRMFVQRDFLGADQFLLPWERKLLRLLYTDQQRSNRERQKYQVTSRNTITDCGCSNVTEAFFSFKVNTYRQVTIDKAHGIFSLILRCLCPYTEIVDAALIHCALRQFLESWTTVFFRIQVMGSFTLSLPQNIPSIECSMEIK